MDLLNIVPHQVTYGVSGKHFLFYGPPSTRKTTVATSFPNSILFATEIGYQFIQGVQAINITSWYDFTKAVRQLKNPEVKARFQTVVIDTISLLQDMAIQFICDKHGIEALGDIGFGKGWTDYRKEMAKQLNYIAQLGYGIVFSDHSREERNDDGKIIAAKPRMDNTTSTIVNALVDFTFFLKKEYKEGVDQPSVFAYSQLPDVILTKSRAMFMSKRFEFTFENLEKELKLAIEKQMEFLGQEINEEVLGHGDNKYIPPEQIDIEVLKTEIASKGRILMEKGLSARVNEMMATALGGLSFNETTETHRAQLLALNEVFTELTEE